MNAVTFHFVHGFHPSLLPVQQVLLGVSFLLAAFALLDRYVPRWISLPSLALLVTAPWFWWRMQSILPDQTLAYLLSLAAARLHALAARTPRPPGSRLAVAFLAPERCSSSKARSSERFSSRSCWRPGFLRFRREAIPALLLLLGPARRRSRGGSG